MAKGLRYRKLSLEGTLNAGLSLIVVISATLLLSAGLVSLAYEFRVSEDYFVCENGAEVPVSYVQDGDDDCGDNSDESVWAYVEVTQNEDSIHTRTAYHFGIFSYMMLGASIIVFLSGVFGLITKIMADSISAGLALHAENTHDSEVQPLSETPPSETPSGPPSIPPSETSKYTIVDDPPISP